MGIASWEGLWATFVGTHPRLDGLAAWAPTYRHDAWRSALLAAGRTHGAALDAEAQSMAAGYIAGQRSGHPVLPGAVDLVRRLAASVPVAVVTNGPPDIQRLKIEQSGVGPFLSAVVISGELGVGKPHPDMFRTALDLLGVPPGRAAMVGDNWERDVCGARAVGMRAVWISHGRVPPGPGPSAPGPAAAGPTAAADRITVARGPADVALV